MHDLVTSTEENHFEAYRIKNLTESGRSDDDPSAFAKKNLASKMKLDEEALRKKFTEQVRMEETRFRKWEQNLIAERDRLNKDLEDHHKIVQELQNEVDSLQTISTQAYRKMRLDSLKMADKYPNFEQNTKEITVSYGRVTSLRSMGKKLMFVDTRGTRLGMKRDLQIVLSANDCTGFKGIKEQLAVGDIFEFKGTMGFTPAGQESLFASEGRLLAPCIYPIPNELKDRNSILRNAALNFIINNKDVENLRTRSKVISHIRSFLEERDFLGVETPILSSQAGGASARPFVTHIQSLDLQLQLRIAPELYLKQLVIGGLDKIYEIGKQFRNEGLDATHNPEFTTLEVYEAYTTLEAMKCLTEDLIKQILTNYSSGPITIHHDSIETTLNLEEPFRTLDVMTELTAQYGTLPDVNLNESIPALLELLPNYKGTPTLGKILDAMISTIETKCIQPTFLMGHPTSISPLAKESTGGKSERFELFIGGKEYSNAYSELNDPIEQRLRFERQLVEREAGDSEAQLPDEAYLAAMELGLPPTVGMGLGIDRLCMLVCNVKQIREVIGFPIARPMATDL